MSLSLALTNASFLVAFFTKCATGYVIFLLTRHCQLCLCPTTPIPMVFSSCINFEHSYRLTTKLNYLTKFNKNFIFFKMRSDLNFYPTSDKNYTAEEPNSSNSFARIFSNFGQTDFYPNHAQNTIINFSQSDIIRTIHIIVVFIQIHIHLFVVII
jgi:hypothetical protein